MSSLQVTTVGYVVLVAPKHIVISPAVIKQSPDRQDVGFEMRIYLDYITTTKHRRPIIRVPRTFEATRLFYSDRQRNVVLARSALRSGCIMRNYADHTVLNSSYNAAPPIGRRISLLRFTFVAHFLSIQVTFRRGIQKRLLMTYGPNLNKFMNLCTHVINS